MAQEIKQSTIRAKHLHQLMLTILVLHLVMKIWRINSLQMPLWKLWTVLQQKTGCTKKNQPHSRRVSRP